MISEHGKLAQKEYKTKHDWVGEVIHRELCKMSKFAHTKERHMHIPESILENEMLWNFEIQMDHLISARRPDQVIANKKQRTSRIVDFAVRTDHRIKVKESEKKDKYLDLVRERI